MRRRTGITRSQMEVICALNKGYGAVPFSSICEQMPTMNVQQIRNALSGLITSGKVRVSLPVRGTKWKWYQVTLAGRNDLEAFQAN